MTENLGSNVNIPASKVVAPGQAEHQDRLPDFSYDILVKPEDGYGFSLIKGTVHPNGESKPKKMLSVTRTYTILAGSGKFWLDNKEFDAAIDSTYIVGPGSVYSFKAGDEGLKVFEVNKFEQDYKIGDPMYQKVDQK